MNFLPNKKGLYLFLISIVSVQASFAQAKLSANGAKINLAPTVFLSTNDIVLNNSSLLSVSGSTLKVADSIVSSNAIDVSNGTLEMNGTTTQKIPANSLTGNVIKNLTINNINAVVSIGGPLNLTDVLTLSNGSLASNGNLTLKSIVSKTARVAPVTTTAGVAVSGNVIVERYITSKRAYRFLTAPVNTAGSIRANWMENTNNPSTSVNNNPVPGFGTHVTGYAGNAGGFDVTVTNNPSFYTYDNANQVWNAIPNTGSTLNPGIAYRVFVRGSRSTNLNSNTPPSSITTLRATGTLISGTFVMASSAALGTPGFPVLSSAMNGYSFVGNPYASPIDWTLVERTNLASSIYVFDPTITGSNGRGAYVSYNENTGVSNTSSMVDNNIQSGQSFFVQTSGASPSLTIKEIHKSIIDRRVFRTHALPNISLLLLLPGQDTAGGAADGLAAYFSDDFSQKLGDEDSYKITNQDENIAILRDNKTLSIEGRKPVTSADTLPLKMWQLSQKKYSFKIALSHLDGNVTTYLEDGFLHTNQLLNNDAATLVPFSITSDSASLAADRFKIVFKNASTLATALSGIKAYEKDKGVEVEWTAESQNNVEQYEIEKSANAQQFAKVGSVKAKLSGISSFYNWFDQNPFIGENYYRIKSVTRPGEVLYSSVVKVNIKDINEIVSVFVNPDKSNTINIILKNIEKGNYNISLINELGQKMYASTLDHPGGSATKALKLNNFLPGGIYHLQLANGSKVFNVSVFIK